MGLFLMNLRVKKRDGTVVPFNEEKYPPNKPTTIQKIKSVVK